MNHKIISTTKIGYLQDNFGSKCVAGYTGRVLGTQAVNRKAILDTCGSNRGDSIQNIDWP